MGKMPSDPKDTSGAAPTSALGRLTALGRQLIPSVPFGTRSASTESSDGKPEELGTLRLGPHVEIPVTQPTAPQRLPTDRLLLDLRDPVVSEHLEWLGKKWLLGQDVL